MMMRLEPGERMMLPVPTDKTAQSFMQNIASDIMRNGLRGVMHQTLIFGVEPGPRKLHEIVMICRDPLPPVKAATKRKAPAKVAK